MEVTSTYSSSLYEFYDRYNKDLLKLPAHQHGRGSVWPNSKKKTWWNDIRAIAKDGGGIIGGMIVTYRLQESFSNNIKVFYINDGANRIVHSLQEFINMCVKSGEDWKTILQSCKITEQQVIYRDLHEAIEHYWKINLGTTCTPYEMTYALLVEKLDNFPVVWKPIIDELFDYMKNITSRMGCKSPKERSDKHKFNRDNFMLFYKFISKDQTRWSFKVATKELNTDNWKKSTELEEKLIQQLLAIGVDGVKKELEAFKKHVTEHCALYEALRKETNIPNTHSPSPVHFRWWLLVSIYRRNNDFDFKIFREFSLKLLEKCSGKTTVSYSDTGDIKDVAYSNTALSHLVNLATIYHAVGVNIEGQNKRSKKNQPKLKDGYVNSHILAHSIHGDGTTIPENALDNGFRLNRDMTEDEEQKLKVIS